MTNNYLLYHNYETKRKTFVTSLNKYNQQIKEELLQYSLDLNSSHIDYINELLFDYYIPLLKEFRDTFTKLKNG